jgi:hypothetical protein
MPVEVSVVCSTPTHWGTHATVAVGDPSQQQQQLNHPDNPTLVVEQQQQLRIATNHMMGILVVTSRTEPGFAGSQIRSRVVEIMRLRFSTIIHEL